uniref:NADH:ubiquinone reductase (H(+)-translocating) n=1 Tax=Polyascus gregaria TaxID=238043 RepID=H8ZWM7_9CRUS|nr:NADH dehydrogenase subunit 5 [Polyascus gregaria]
MKFLNLAIMYMILLFFLSLFSFMFMIYLNLYYIDWNLSFNYFLMNSNLIDLYYLFDWLNFLIVSIVFFVTFFIYTYILYYMNMDMFYYLFLKVVFIFVISMIMFLFMVNMFSCIFGWDGLGLTSYILIIYYNNVKSLNSGMYTLMLNRLGDFFILVSLGGFLIYGSVNFFCFVNLKFNFIFLLLIFIIISSITKSAQFPFSSWLPKAMLAPTPVSSLVHSSTLVVAGVYLIMRFDSLILLFDLKVYIMYISLLTGFISSYLMFMEYDLKKLVAMTTLIQLSFMFISLSLGCMYQSLLHLLLHAMYKSSLFMSSGYLIFLGFGNQDMRFLMGSFLNCYMFKNSFFILNLSSMGFPFLGGFYSKDMMLGMFYMSELNIFYILMFIFIVFFTFLGTFRMYYYMMNLNIILIYTKFSMFILSFVIYFSCMMVILFSYFYFWFFDDYELVFVNFYLKFILIYFMMISLFIYLISLLSNMSSYLYLMFNYLFFDDFYTNGFYFIFYSYFYYYLLFLDSILNYMIYKNFIDLFNNLIYNLSYVTMSLLIVCMFWFVLL